MHAEPRRTEDERRVGPAGLTVARLLGSRVGTRNIPTFICRYARLRAAFRPVFEFGPPGRACLRFSVGRLRNSEIGERLLHVIVDRGFELLATAVIT